MRHWVLFVARRFLGTRRARGAGATSLATAGIAAGVATLIVVLAVMNGFQLGTIENILEINSFHIRLSPDRSLDEYRALQSEIEEVRETRGVAAAVPTAEVQTLARGFWPEPQGIVMRAMPSDWLQRDPGARERMEIEVGEFDIGSDHAIVLGAELARSLGVRVGDPIAVTHIPDGSARPAEVELEVTGLFRTGYLDFDRTWAFVALDTAISELQSREALVIGVKLTNRFRDADVAQRLRRRLPRSWEFETWREFNRGIFGALRVEKSMMAFLVALIFVVVAGNIFQLLRRSIIERSEEIAILRSLGGAAHQVRRIFIIEGWLIGIIGTAVGTAVGLLIAGNVNEIFAGLERAATLLGGQGSQVFSPQYFYLEEIPVRILAHEVLLIGVGAIGISALAALLAGRAVAGRRPMELLRSE